MTPDVVVDIGNTRMKWGFCHSGQITGMVSLDTDDPVSWDRFLPSGSGLAWAVASGLYVLLSNRRTGRSLVSHPSPRVLA